MLQFVNAVRAGRQNRVVILEAVQRGGAVSRSQLVTTTGLTPATITNAVRELIELRLLRPTGTLVPRAPATAGAPSELLSLDPAWHRVLSVHQGVSLTRLGLHDIAGRVLAAEEIHAQPGQTPEAAVREIGRELRRLVAGEDVERDQVRSVGVGAVGLIDPENGRVRVAPNLGWTDVPLGEWLQAALGWPVVVRNNVHAMAAGEARFVGIPEQDAVYTYVGTGIGSGIIIGGRVRDGAHGAAGEIGHLLVPGGTRCTCGKVGCLETIAAEPAIVSRAGAALGEWPAGAHKAATARLVELALAGEGWAKAHLVEVAASLGGALAQVVEILDPGAVILNGIIAEAGDLVLGPLARSLHQSAFAVRGRRVAVRRARFGRQAGLVGAATLALDAHVYHPNADLFTERTLSVAR
jgi:predicted NBD/HSP70 family sugar kinase